MTTRKISNSLDYEQFDTIVCLILGIKDGLKSMLETYKHYFSELEVRDITQKLELVKRLIGEELLAVKELPLNYLSDMFGHRERRQLFKQNARKIFRIEEECKKYASRIWAGELTKVSEFDTTKPFKLLVCAFRDEDIDKQMKYLREKKIKHLPTSLITNNFLGLFHNSHYGIIYEANENNYLAAYERDAESGYYKIGSNSTSLFEKKIDVGALKVEEDDFIGCSQPAVITKTPDFIEKVCLEKWFVEKDIRYGYSEILLDRRYSNPKGVFCIIFGSELLSPAYRKAEKIADELNLPLICIDKDSLCKKNNLMKLTLFDMYEIMDGLEMNLGYSETKKFNDLIYKTSMNDPFENKINIYLQIFENIKNEPNLRIIKRMNEEIAKITKLKQRCTSNMILDF